MIELTEVTKRYGRRGSGADALRDVSFAIPRGAVWAVVGPNGAGKSTLLALLLGFIRPTAGAVAISGEAPRDYLRQHGAGYLPERFGLPSGWRAGEALRMLARLERASPDAAARVVTLLGLEPHLDRRVAELSRGVLQRLGIAQALLARRRLIVLDEPTEGLDPIWRVRLRDIVEELRDDERTVVMASHDLSEVERIADSALVLDNGAVRDVLAVRVPHASTDYRIRLALPFDDVAGAFPAAARTAEREFVVGVSSPGELSHRLGALIAMGAVIAAVEPVRHDLEERVRGALDGGV